MIANALFSRRSKAKGFTLLELLIVITILAILAVIIIFVLNPAETLRKSRDVQRMSDLATLKNAISLYTTTKTTPQLDGTSGTVNDKCNAGTAANEELWVSVPTAVDDITDTTPPSGWVQAEPRWEQPTTVSAGSAVDGTGWIPVNLGSISGGSPISNMPLDPTNDLTITTGSDTSAVNAVTNGALMYRYACDKTNVTYEINARLESTAFGTGSTDDNKASKDGGDNPLLYEVGTLLTILPDTNDF